MTKAIVTGASKGIGLEITKRLLSRGWFVYGIGRNFDNLSLGDNFSPLVVNLKDGKRLFDEVKKICRGVTLLINSAGVGAFAPHEEISPEKIREIMAVNAEAPMIISGIMLREMKRHGGGRIINISSYAAKHTSPHGAVYGASKAALTAFSDSIFAEGRKFGVYITAVHPDITRTGFYEKAPFEPKRGDDFALSPSDVADAVEFIINADHPIKEITLLPKKQGIVYKK